MVPAVTMTINANVTGILKLKEVLNNRNEEGPHITITHIVMKTVADVLMHYPLLYGFFNGKNLIENKELILNIPVDIESHVEYITVYNPAAKSLVEISAECQEEIILIQEGRGKFIGFLKDFNDMPVNDLFFKTGRQDTFFKRALREFSYIKFWLLPCKQRRSVHFPANYRRPFHWPYYTGKYLLLYGPDTVF